MDMLIVALLVITAVLLVVILVMVMGSRTGQSAALSNQDKRMSELRQIVSEMVQQQDRRLVEIRENLQAANELQDKRLTELRRDMTDIRTKNEEKLEDIRVTVDRDIKNLREENEARLKEMQGIVDEKLQKTLEERIGQSFRLVNERLEQVHKGLGEMQTLAAGVGDLKKVLSNVKTRGTLGEIQLGAILQEILAPGQYEENFRTKSTGRELVEFAVKMPGGGENPVYLPVDSKFPMDRYEHLLDAYEIGDKTLVQKASKELADAITKEGKDIRDKYVEPPLTTEFAILFLPVEGLYAEAVKLGLVEKLQSEFRITIAGPTTMAALLNSIQMGFRTMAMREQSNKIWGILEGVKTEFEKFEEAIRKAQTKITQAGSDLDKLVGARTRAINRKLRDVSVTGDRDVIDKIVAEIEAGDDSGDFDEE